MNPLVSIITPSYNSEKFIARTIDSVMAQSYRHWEMLIIDDGSVDSSKDIITAYIRKNDKIKLLECKQNLGAARARNLGIKNARGRYIAFLDSDDLWLPGKLEKQIAFMQANNLLFTYSSYRLIDEEDNDLGIFVTKKYINYEDTLRTCSIGCLTAIYDSERLGKIYMPNISKKEDYGLWLTILKRIKSTAGLEQPLSVYRIRKYSLSSNKLSAAIQQWAIYRQLEGLSLARSCYYFMHYAYHGLKKCRYLK